MPSLTIKSRFADTSHGRIHYLASGAGFPLVLFGPAGKSAHVFDPLIAQLGSRFHVLAMDLPGHGQSHPMAARFSIEDLADEMLEALAAAGIGRAHFFGLHTGNKLCAAIAARHPTRVEKLVLCGQSHSIVPEQERRNSIIAGMTHGAEKLECDTTALYEANFAYDLGADFARITAPTLVLELVTSEEDQTVGRQTGKVRALLAGPSCEAQLVHASSGFCTLEHLAVETAAVLVAFLEPTHNGGT
jgi:hypothetical protein